MIYPHDHVSILIIPVRTVRPYIILLLGCLALCFIHSLLSQEATKCGCYHTYDVCTLRLQGSQTIGPRRIRFCSVGLLICGWSLGFCGWSFRILGLRLDLGPISRGFLLQTIKPLQKIGMSITCLIAA